MTHLPASGDDGRRLAVGDDGGRLAVGADGRRPALGDDSHRPGLDVDPESNRHTLQDLLDSAPAGTLELPPGDHAVSGGLRVPAGWTVRGAAGPGGPSTWLSSVASDGSPVLHIIGSGVSVSDIGLRPPPSDPGEHGGDRGTALTVGEYLYSGDPAWITDVEIRRVQVVATGRTANSVALMGAVRDVTVHDVTVHGGYTGVAVHWGAAGAGVDSITGPTYHPNRLTITNLRVRDAVEGFYLSSVHDVRVTGACLRDVEMGFRLLPGDNTDRFHRDPAARVGDRIDISDVCVQWTGDKYGVRVAGWGRSEVDGVISTLDYRDTRIRECVVRRVPPPADPGRPGAAAWSPVLLERADGVAMHNVRVESGATDACPHWDR